MYFRAPRTQAVALAPEAGRPERAAAVNCAGASRATTNAWWNQPALEKRYAAAIGRDFAEHGVGLVPLPSAIEAGSDSERSRS